MIQGGGLKKLEYDSTTGKWDVRGGLIHPAVFHRSGQAGR